MNVMVSGVEYWFPVYEMFKQAGQQMGCDTIYTGTPEYDVNKQIASFDQVLARQPKGILVHPMNSDPFIEPINRAIEQGTAIVTFAAEFAELQPHRAHHLEQRPRRHRRRRCDRRGDGRQGRICGAGKSRPGQSRPPHRRLHRPHGSEVAGHEAGGRAASNQDAEQGLSGRAVDGAGQSEPRRGLHAGGQLGARRGAGELETRRQDQGDDAPTSTPRSST